MLSGSRISSRIALISGLLLGGPAALAEPWPKDDNVAPQPLRVAQRPQQPISGSQPLTKLERNARDLALRYLDLWSGPNDVALASASAFYGQTVRFHGRTRTIDSVLAEKRRFAERWPDRAYRHRPSTTQVECDTSGARCIVKSSFDFTAVSPSDGRRSLGIGEHELVVSLASGRPVIAAENSRVVLYGRGNMTSLLEEAL